MNRFQMISLIYCQFAWKSNILNLNRKIIVLFDQRVDPTWLPHLAFKHTCFYLRNWNLLCDSLCQCWLVRLLLNRVLIIQISLQGLHSLGRLFLVLIILKVLSQLFPIWTAKLPVWWDENTSNFQSTISIANPLRCCSISHLQLENKSLLHLLKVSCLLYFSIDTVTISETLNTPMSQYQQCCNLHPARQWLLHLHVMCVNICNLKLCFDFTLLLPYILLHHCIVASYCS